MNATAGLYFEDFSVGQTFASGPITVEAERTKAFAAEFDPQPFHLDEAAGAASFFGELVASGWHTAALTMRLLVGSDLKVVGGLIGVGVEDLKWPRPVRPGDVLHIAGEVLDVRTSKSRDDLGIVKSRITTLNQDGLPVLSMVVNMIVPRKVTWKGENAGLEEA